MTETVTMRGGYALQGVIEPILIPAFERQAGARVSAVWEPTSMIVKALKAGERSDVVVLADEAIDELAGLGFIAPRTRTPLANAILGLAVGRGQPKPDIATPDAFRRALLDCRAIAYSKAGASGIYFEKLIEQLGIADSVREKAVVIPFGLTAEKLVSGETDLAIQQISELMMVEGIDLIGPLPDEIGCVTGFSAAILGTSPHLHAAQQFIALLSSVAAMQAYAAAGLAPRLPTQNEGD